MKDALTFIVNSIVTDPKKTVIEESEDNGTLLFTISVPKEDMGKMIGKDGKVIRAIRNVMKIPAIKQNRRISISLLEQE